MLVRRTSSGLRGRLRPALRRRRVRHLLLELDDRASPHVREPEAVRSRGTARCASYYVQTPAKSFPFEPHWLGFFVHWLPRRWQPRVARWGTVYGLAFKPTASEVDALIDEYRLLVLPRDERAVPRRGDPAGAVPADAEVVRRSPSRRVTDALRAPGRGTQHECPDGVGDDAQQLFVCSAASVVVGPIERTIRRVRRRVDVRVRRRRVLGSELDRVPRVDGSRGTCSSGRTSSGRNCPCPGCRSHPRTRRRRCAVVAVVVERIALDHATVGVGDEERLRVHTRIRAHVVVLERIVPDRGRRSGLGPPAPRSPSSAPAGTFRRRCRPRR